MEAFEDNLCTTVDAILELLGETPRVVRGGATDPPRGPTPGPPRAVSAGSDPLRPHRIDLPQSQPSSARTRTATPGVRLAQSHSTDMGPHRL